MPWLTIIMAVLTFFLSGGAKKEKRGQAALAAIGVGAGTYYVTRETDWGKQNLGFLDGVEVTTNPDGSVSGRTGPGKPEVHLTGGNEGGSTGTGSLWNTLSGWLTTPAGQLTTGAAAGKVLGVPNWLLYGGIAVGAYLLLKD